MIQAFRTYPATKDSGVSGLGVVPAHWNVERLRTLVDLRVSNVDKHSNDGELPVRLCNYVDVYKNQRIAAHIPFMRATASPEEIERFRLQVGDVLITKDSEAWNDIGVPSYVEHMAPDLVCGYHLALLRPRDGVILGSYLFRAIQSQGVTNQFHVLANGVTRYGLSHQAIKSILLPVPPLDEQEAIVRFLAHADRSIWNYIRAKQKLVKLLEEQNQSMVDRLVTRGLDPDAPLKPSGVEGLGCVPEHWEMLRTRYLFREIDNRSQAGEETHLSMSQKLGLVPNSMVEQLTLMSESYAGGKLCDVDDLVLNRLKAHLGVFALASQRGVISPDYTVFRKIRQISMKFYEYLLRSTAFRRELRIRAKGIVQGFWRLYTDDFYNISVPVPPIDEQQKIVTEIQVSRKSTDAVIARAEKEINFLKEYRMRLIADVVTGKCDVREESAKLPVGIKELVAGRDDEEPTVESEEKVDSESQETTEEAEA